MKVLSGLFTALLLTAPNVLWAQTQPRTAEDYYNRGNSHVSMENYEQAI